MKAIIGGKLHDTARAEKISSYTRNALLPGFRLGPSAFDLYVTSKGAYFERHIDSGRLIPCSEEYAKEVLRLKGPDKYIEMFGEVEEA